MTPPPQPRAARYHGDSPPPLPGPGAASPGGNSRAEDVPRHDDVNRGGDVGAAGGSGHALRLRQALPGQRGVSRGGTRKGGGVAGAPSAGGAGRGTIEPPGALPERPPAPS